MLAFLRSFLPGGVKPIPRAVQVALEPVHLATSTPLFNGTPIPSYPERGDAVPAAPPDALIASQRELIDKLHQVSSFSRADFDAYVVPAIWNYAACVHLLPASESHHHYGQGGLFRHGLEVAFNSARACEGKIFAFDRWASERDRLVPRWRMCALLGGMLHDMGKSILDVGAVDETGDLVWNPHQGTLWDWLQKHRLTHYFIHWRSGPRHKRHEGFSTVSTYRVVPQATLDWIGDHGGQEPLDAMIAALGQEVDANNPLISILKKADSLSVEKDIKESRSRLAASGLGGQRSLAARLVRAMHDQIQSGAWRINEVGSPIWVTTQGTFGLYPAIVENAVAVLRADGDKSLPNEASKYLDVLADFGVLQENITASGTVFNTWNLRLHANNRGKPVQIDQKAIRFAREDLMPQTMVMPTPVNADLLDENRQPLRNGSVTPPPAAAAAPASIVAAPAGAPAPATSTPTVDQVPRRAAAPRDLAPAMNDALIFGTEEDLSPLLVSDDDDVPDLMAALERGDDADAPATPVLRDRANEPEVRQQMLTEAYTTMNAAFPPATVKGAIDWLRNQEQGGSILIALGKRIQTAELVEGTDVFEHREHVYFRFPEAFTGLGTDPLQIREQFEKNQWTERDADAPKRATNNLQLGNKKIISLRLTHGMSKLFLLFMLAKNADGSTGVVEKPKRHPRGPQIDADTNALIRDGNQSLPEDSPLIRSAFYQFAVHAARKRDRMPADLPADELRVVVGQFARTHNFSNNYTEQHLTRSPNNVITKAGTAICYAQSYRYEDDLALVNAMSPR